MNDNQHPIVDKEQQKGIKELTASPKEKPCWYDDDEWDKLIHLVTKNLINLFKGQNIEVNYTTQTVSLYELEKRQFDMSCYGSALVFIDAVTILQPFHVDHFLKSIKGIRRYFTSEAEKKIYGGLAYSTSHSKTHVYAEQQGLFLIKATGDSVSIINQPGFKPKAF